MFFLTKLHLLFFLMVICARSGMEHFVVGGLYKTIEDYPHCIYLSVDCSKRWICGASILNQNILITAAHCVNVCKIDDPSHSIKALAGHENLERVKSKREIGVIKFHEHYSERTVANDIALVGLKRSLYLGHSIKRIIINPQFPNVQRGQVAGWGIVDKESTASSLILKAVSQKIRSAPVCALIGKLEIGMFCAGSTMKDAQHPANGDSGSALITEDYTELGLVSFRSKRLAALMVYTNLTYYYDWIEKNARRLYCQICEKNILGT